MSAIENWLSTGVWDGFGRLLAEAAIARGDSVAGTLRQAGLASAFEAWKETTPGTALAEDLGNVH